MKIKQRIGYAVGGTNYYKRKKLKDIVAITRIFYDNWDDESYRHYLDAFKLDENLVDVLKNRTSSTDVPANKGHYVFLNSEGSVAVEASDRSDLNVDPADPCPPGNTKRYMLVRSYFRKLELSNPDNPAEKTNIAYYRWQGFD